MRPKNTSSSNFTDTFLLFFLFLVFVVYSKLQALEKELVMVLLYQRCCFLFYHHVSMILIKKFTVTIHPQRNLISVPQKAAYTDFFPTAIITGESLFCF